MSEKAVAAAMLAVAVLAVAAAMSQTLAVAFGGGALVGAVAAAMYYKEKSKVNHDELKQELEESLNTWKDGEVASDPGLHWMSGTEHRGLMPLLHSLNHVALIVRDVGQSLYFYSDIIGFQQIRRPNFDRHGAWLTMGNVELHLIKGDPACSRGQHPADLIVPHLAVEVKDSDKVLERLRELKANVFTDLTWRQNISVPTPSASRAEKFETGHTSSAGKMVQFFVEDPDGYWMELCNCDILTDFCLGKDDLVMDTYHEGCHGEHHGLDVASGAKIAVKTMKWAGKAMVKNHHWENIVKKVDDCTPVPLDQVNQTYLENLKKRRNTYGDICQGFSDDDLANALAKTGNSVPKAIIILKNARVEVGQTFFPPSFLIESEEVSKNKAFAMPVHAEVVKWGEKNKISRGTGHHKDSAQFAHEFVEKLRARQASR